MPKLKSRRFVRRKEFRRLRPPPSPVFRRERSVLAPPLPFQGTSEVSDLVYNEPLLETALCELSLRKFVEAAWRVIEPETPFVGNWHIDGICEHLEALSKRIILRLIINIPPRHMKLCADSTIVPTPQGYKRHGDLRKGDYVFGPHGKPVKVIKISEKDVADCIVRFQNGSEVKVNRGHLWTVYDRTSRIWKTVTTEYLLNSTLCYYDKGKRHNRFAIPDCKAFEFPEKDLPIPPYFLGCWLGDGTSVKACITHDDKDTEHLEKIRSLGIKASTVCKNGENTSTTYFSHQGIIDKLRETNLWKNKHIPEIYQLSSKTQRLELLAGLIDTDGHVCKITSRVRISTVNKSFANDILRLVRSLGFNGYISKAEIPLYEGYQSDNQFVYQVGFQPNMQIPTAIPRKKIKRLDAVRRKRYIEDVFISRNPEIGNCITVDSADGLYVVGKKNIVTHNSLTSSVLWPAWDWIGSPHERNIYASYASTLSERDNIKFGRLIHSRWYQERWADRFKLITDTQVKIENDRGGYRIATSVGGVATGEGGSKIIADDPHNVKDVSSEAKRVGALLWWDEVMASRLDNIKTGIRLIIMQRSHENDLTGHILAKEMGYDHLCLPARYEGNRCHTKLNFIDQRTVQGEPLWKEKFGEEELVKLEEELGEYATAGQLQQRPTPRGGGMFKVRNLLIMQSYAPDYIQAAVRFWDKAGSKDKGMYTCGALLLKTKDKKYIIADIVRGQWDASERESKIKLTTQMDFAEMRKNRIRYTVWVEQEPGSGGKESTQSTVRNLAGYPIYAERPTGKKEIRAEPFSCQVNMGNVGILERSWMQECMDRLEFYPATKYKDWGDALGGAFNKLNSPKRSGVWGTKQSEDKK